MNIIQLFFYIDPHNLHQHLITKNPTLPPTTKKQFLIKTIDENRYDFTIIPSEKPGESISNLKALPALSLSLRGGISMQIRSTPYSVRTVVVLFLNEVENGRKMYSPIKRWLLH
ncbi:hypothetical protein CEXT_538041 [Caerostris extrusa]|uniref:Uncharacterized protein n=1 Tax=Caerostris extrusa TaxID=172846 RepID=A0AAV4XJ06_CAEEX|nr:hypothetical protein CEXT_538041 [Caerostris extrusa]